MPFIKKGLAPTVSQETMDRLNEATVPTKLSTAPVVSHSPVAKGRDFDAEARGKTRCALEEAWAQSPLLPMLVADPSDLNALHAMLDNIVTERMKRVFPNG